MRKLSQEGLRDVPPEVASPNGGQEHRSCSREVKPSGQRAAQQPGKGQAGSWHGLALQSESSGFLLQVRPARREDPAASEPVVCKAAEKGRPWQKVQSLPCPRQENKPEIH